MGLGREPLRLLHFAPEYALRERIEALDRVDYVTADLDPAGVDVQLDITAMPFGDDEFDGVICSHVLEHVDDDRAAMSELARVLRPGGWLLVLVPLDPGRERTHEDPSVRTPEEREREFLQRDHVRLYAPDIADRLRDAGFGVEVIDLHAELGADGAARHGLLASDLVFLCRP
jgi:SAM-dependent methyltransferase